MIENDHSIPKAAGRLWEVVSENVEWGGRAGALIIRWMRWDGMGWDKDDEWDMNVSMNVSVSVNVVTVVVRVLITIMYVCT